MHALSAVQQSTLSVFLAILSSRNQTAQLLNLLFRSSCSSVSIKNKVIDRTGSLKLKFYSSVITSKVIALKTMGTVPKMPRSIKNEDGLVPMQDCCDLAYLILREGRSFITQKLADRKECDSKVWSREFQKSVSTHFIDLQRVHGYSPEEMDFCYAPKIEGGDNYNVYLKRDRYGPDTFKRSVGIRLRNRYCYYVRTLAFHGSWQMQVNHEFINLVYEFILRNLKDGVELREVYHAAMSFAQEENENLAKHLEKELGFELCSNFKNESVVINSYSNAIARRGMFFALNVNLIGLEEKGARYNLYYSDTVIVRQDETPITFIDYKTTITGIKRCPEKIQSDQRNE